MLPDHYTRCSTKFEYKNQAELQLEKRYANRSDEAVQHMLNEWWGIAKLSEPIAVRALSQTSNSKWTRASSRAVPPTFRNNDGTPVSPGARSRWLFTQLTPLPSPAFFLSRDPCR